MYACMYVCMGASMSSCVHMCVRMCVCVHICLCITAWLPRNDAKEPCLNKLAQQVSRNVRSQPSRPLFAPAVLLLDAVKALVLVTVDAHLMKACQQAAQTRRHSQQLATGRGAIPP